MTIDLSCLSRQRSFVVYRLHRTSLFGMCTSLGCDRRVSSETGLGLGSLVVRAQVFSGDWLAIEKDGLY
jgi:Na+-transporting NADH:ubiquinone oxidoreductase subunit NqrE